MKDSFRGAGGVGGHFDSWIAAIRGLAGVA